MSLFGLYLTIDLPPKKWWFAQWLVLDGTASAWKAVFVKKTWKKWRFHPAKLAISQPWKLGVQLEKRDFHGIFNGICSIKRVIFNGMFSIKKYGLNMIKLDQTDESAAWEYEFPFTVILRLHLRRDNVGPPSDVNVGL